MTRAELDTNHAGGAGGHGRGSQSPDGTRTSLVVSTVRVHVCMPIILS